MKRLVKSNLEKNQFLAVMLLTGFVFLLGLSTAQAQQTAAPQKSVRKQSINFEDELIEGNVQKPDLFYIFQKKNFNYKRLIKLRENFLPEMRKTSEDIQRVRGGN